MRDHDRRVVSTGIEQELNCRRIRVMRGAELYGVKSAFGGNPLCARHRFESSHIVSAGETRKRGADYAVQQNRTRHLSLS
jgi:hypothetical protein